LEDSFAWFRAIITGNSRLFKNCPGILRDSVVFPSGIHIRLFQDIKFPTSYFLIAIFNLYVTWVVYRRFHRVFQIELSRRQAENGKRVTNQSELRA
jgi:hypothetical protein